MEIRPGIDVDRNALVGFFRRHEIRRLALFGSALGEDFGPESDIDLLVEFSPDRVPGLFQVAAMELELAPLFGGREVELRTLADLIPHFRQDVRRRAVLLFGP